MKSEINKIRLLIGISKSHDISEFDAAVNNVLSKFDKFYTCYFPMDQSRHLIKEYFLKHVEYTHLVILPDDLLVNKESVDLLLDNLAQTDYEVLVGCCNVDSRENKTKINVSLYPVSPIRENGTFVYKFISIFDSYLFSRPQPSIVQYQGDAFLILRRDIVPGLSFDTDAKLNDIDAEQGCCNDVVMSYELSKLGIRIYCNLKARFRHLKISDTIPISKNLVGEEIAFTRFVKAT